MHMLQADQKGHFKRLSISRQSVRVRTVHFVNESKIPFRFYGFSVAKRFLGDVTLRCCLLSQDGVSDAAGCD